LAVLPGRASGLVVLVLVSPRSLRAPRDVSRKRLFQQRPIRMDDDLPPRTLPNTCSGHGDRKHADHPPLSINASLSANEPAEVGTIVPRF